MNDEDHNNKESSQEPEIVKETVPSEGNADNAGHESPSNSEVIASSDEPRIISTGEMVDRAELKALKAAKKKKEKEARLASAKGKGLQSDNITAALNHGRIAKARRAKKILIGKIVASLIGVYLLYGAYNYLFSSYKAGPSYGICKVYLENQVRFPKYLKYIGLDDFGDNVRIWFSRIDSFGIHRVENIRCYYKYDEEVGSSIVERVTIERREEPQDRIDSFNVVLPVVLKNLPDLSWPRPDSDKNLNNIQTDESSVRKRVF